MAAEYGERRQSIWPDRRIAVIYRRLFLVTAIILGAASLGFLMVTGN
jgi:hypothetical protein